MKKRANIIEKGFSQVRMALLGVALFMPVLVEAATSASVLVRVRVGGGDVAAPNAITDLAAFPTPNEGEVLLTWSAPADLPFLGSVAGYQIRYATFSVADVGGSTTTWWNAATSYAVSVATQAPNQPQGVSVSPLTGGTYYFAIRSFDGNNNFSALDSAAVLGPQVSATPRSERPAPVSGYLSEVFPVVNWNPVVMNQDGSPLSDLDTVSPYEVRRSTSLTSFFNIIVSSGAAASSFSVSVATASTTEYVMVVARDQSGNESDPALSNILEISPQGIIGQIALAQDGTFSRTYLPATMMSELQTPSGDLLLHVARNTDPVVNRDPRSLSTYDVSFLSPAQVVDKNFTLSRPAMNVVLQSATPITEGSVGILWWNGTAWIKVGDAQVDETNNTISFYTANPGRYQVRSFQAAGSLTMDKASVFPRIFSPNGDGVNDLVYFVVDNPNGAPVEGKIYDVQGEEVSDMKLGGAGAPTADSMSWGGRDKRGDLVPAGVYIYKVKGEGKTITGTVVVAK